jgi:hypothetical protein
MSTFGNAQSEGELSLYLTAASSAGSGRDSERESKRDLQRNGAPSPAKPKAAPAPHTSHQQSSSHPHAFSLGRDPQASNPFFDRYEYIPNRTPPVVTAGLPKPEQPDRYTIQYREEGRDHIPRYVLQDEQAPNGPLLRVAVFDITDYVSLHALHAFENTIFEEEVREEPQEPSWEDRYPGLKDLLDAADPTKKKPVIKKSPNVEVVIFTGKKSSATPAPMEESTVLPSSTSPTFLSRPETLAKLEDDAIADSTLVDTLMAEAAEAEKNDDNPGDAFVVSHILKHKNYLGKRYFQVAWVGIPPENATWLSEDELEGAEDAIKEYFEPGTKMDAMEDFHERSGNDVDGSDSMSM